MAKRFPSENLKMIEAVLRTCTNGATVDELMRKFVEQPREQDLYEMLEILRSRGRVLVVTESGKTRFLAAPPDDDDAAGEDQKKGDGGAEADVVKLLKPIIDVALGEADGRPTHSSTESRAGNMALSSPQRKAVGNALGNLIGRFASMKSLLGLAGLTIAMLVVTRIAQLVTASPWIAFAIIAGALAVYLAYRWVVQAAPAERSATPPAAASPAAQITVAGAPAKPANEPKPVTESTAVSSGQPSLWRRLTAGRSSRVLLLGGAVAVVAAVAGIWWYVTTPARPSESAITKFLTSSWEPLPVRVTSMKVTFLPAGDVSYDVQIETTEPLFRRLESADYLRAHYPAELTAIEAASAILKGPGGDRIRAAVAAGQGSASPATGQPPTQVKTAIEEIVLITTQTPPGARTRVNATTNAWQKSGAWVFTGEPPKVTSFPGSRAASFASREAGTSAVFAVDLPDDAARLKAVITDQAAYAAKVQVAAQTLSGELERERQQRVESFGQFLRPGTLFTGRAADAFDTAGVAFEITESSANTRRLAALLRNDGGWTDARRFQGEWAVSTDADSCTVTLHSAIGDRIADAGPIVGFPSEWTVILQLKLDGTATVVNPRDWQLRRVDSASSSEVKSTFMRAVAPALAATKSGAVYRGTVTSNVRQTAEVLILRFTDQDPDAGMVRAALQSAQTPAWVRNFHGTIVSNTYRAGNTPIQLRSADSERVAQADRNSLLSFAVGGSFTIALRVDGTRLVGGDDRYAYVFEPFKDSGANGAVTQATGVSGTAFAPGATAGTQATADAGSAVAGAGNSSGQGTGGENQGTAPAGIPVDRSAGTPASGPLVTGSTGTSLPPFPAKTGAYVLINGGWVPLPLNNGRLIQSKVQSLSSALDYLTRLEDKMAGKTTEQPTFEVARLTFTGRDPAPVIFARDIVIVYVGPVTLIDPKLIAQYPELKDYPLIELGAVKSMPNGNREGSLVPVGPGLIGFGTNRVDCTIEQPAYGITVLRAPGLFTPRTGNIPPKQLPSGRYGLVCGQQSFEIMLQ